MGGLDGGQCVVEVRKEAGDELTSRGSVPTLLELRPLTSDLALLGLTDKRTLGCNDLD